MELSRAERTRLEVEAGRLRVFKDMADPIVEEFYTFPTAETIAMMTLYKAAQK